MVMAGRWWTVRSTNSTGNFLSSHIVRTGLNLWITIHIFWVILKWSKGSLKVVMPQAYTSMTRERPDWKWVCCRIWKKYASKESWRMSGPFLKLYSWQTVLNWCHWMSEVWKINEREIIFFIGSENKIVMWFFCRKLTAITWTSIVGVKNGMGNQYGVGEQIIARE